VLPSRPSYRWASSGVVAFDGLAGRVLLRCVVNVESIPRSGTSLESAEGANLVLAYSLSGKESFELRWNVTELFG
jgi:hypothetical protein